MRQRASWHLPCPLERLCRCLKPFHSLHLHRHPLPKEVQLFLLRPVYRDSIATFKRLPTFTSAPSFKCFLSASISPLSTAIKKGIADIYIRLLPPFNCLFERFNIPFVDRPKKKGLIFFLDESLGDSSFSPHPPTSRAKHTIKMLKIFHSFNKIPSRGAVKKNTKTVASTIEDMGHQNAAN